MKTLEQRSLAHALSDLAGRATLALEARDELVVRAAEITDAFHGQQVVIPGTLQRVDAETGRVLVRTEDDELWVDPAALTCLPQPASDTVLVAVYLTENGIIPANHTPLSRKPLPYRTERTQLIWSQQQLYAEARLVPARYDNPSSARVLIFWEGRQAFVYRNNVIFGGEEHTCE